MNDIWPLRLDAKNYSFRRNRDGIAWGLIVHPSADCIAVLAAMEPGFEIHVTIEPIKETVTQSGSASVVATTLVPPAIPAAGQKRRELSEGERAVQRAGMLANDTNFRFWASGHACASDANTADFIRRRCAVKSRKEFATDAHARRRFYMLVDAYEQEMGLRAEER